MLTTLQYYTSPWSPPQQFFVFPVLLWWASKYQSLVHIRVFDKIYTLLCNSNSIQTRGSFGSLPLLAWRLKCNDGMDNMMDRGGSCACVWVYGVQVHRFSVFLYGERVPLSWCSVSLYSTCHAGETICVFFLYVFPLCLYLCLHVSKWKSVCCRGFKCPSACPGTSVGWFLHKWNAAVD